MKTIKRVNQHGDVLTISVDAQKKYKKQERANKLKFWFKFIVILFAGVTVVLAYLYAAIYLLYLIGKIIY